MIQISISNQSTLFRDADLIPLVSALQVQVTRDFYPHWGINAQLFYTSSGKQPTVGHWVVALLDDADQAGALGYHDVTPDGQPLGKAFVRTTLADGGKVSVTVSHELLEMLGDPDINLTAEVDDESGPSMLYAYETCDAVEADNLGYDIGGVTVSDFVLPSWFESFRKTGPFAFKTALTAPFELAAGGYIGVLNLNDLSQGWQQLTARTMSARAKVASRPAIGSRRSRRSLNRADWVVSTYAPGTEATPAKQEA